LDDSVIGQAFYLMEYVEGRIASDARLIDVAVDERPGVSLALVAVLAQLHKADYKALNLEGYGRPTAYLARQLSRWSKQYAAARVEPNEDMDRIISWLQDNLPEGDESAIIHGDYRSYNVILTSDTTEVRAVLDWELSTIGHPLADLAYFCLPYHLPADDLRGFRGESPENLNLPSEDEIKTAYCRETGRGDLPHWRYLLVFSLFRSAAIRAGVFKRAHDGTASDPMALELGKGYRGAAARAWELAQAGR
jgi:aminoglycoside phosphotransferase (APT) family kinase protein